jgi:ribosomal protein RSM22 (predicted rRNA methylase)
VVSYLLNRVPRTYAVAKRIISEVKGRYPSFKPFSFLDFGSGLSSGSTAFIEMYGDTGRIYNVEPGSKMRKMGKYLTSYAGISHF